MKLAQRRWCRPSSDFPNADPARLATIFWVAREEKKGKGVIWTWLDRFRISACTLIPSSPLFFHAVRVARQTIGVHENNWSSERET